MSAHPTATTAAQNDAVLRNVINLRYVELLAEVEMLRAERDRALAALATMTKEREQVMDALGISYSDDEDGPFYSVLGKLGADGSETLVGAARVAREAPEHGWYKHVTRTWMTTESEAQGTPAEQFTKNWTDADFMLGPVPASPVAPTPPEAPPCVHCGSTRRWALASVCSDCGRYAPC